jgi:NADH:ubiquinone oxidoreductase subunit C
MYNSKYLKYKHLMCLFNSVQQHFQQLKIKHVYKFIVIDFYFCNSNLLTANYFINLLSHLYYNFIGYLNYLIDITVIDNLAKLSDRIIGGRFLIQYNISSLTSNLFVSFFTYWDRCLSLFSVSNLYGSASWAEREAWDLFGIFFIGNNDLRRILTDYGFTGFPFRRDFPVVGFFELEYNNEIKDLLYVPVSLMQENRFFIYDDSWSI